MLLYKGTSPGIKGKLAEDSRREPAIFLFNPFILTKGTFPPPPARSETPPQVREFQSFGTTCMEVLASSSSSVRRINQNFRWRKLFFPFLFFFLFFDSRVCLMHSFFVFEWVEWRIGTHRFHPSIKRREGTKWRMKMYYRWLDFVDLFLCVWFILDVGFL